MELVNAHRCPHCHEDLHDGLIPQEFIDKGFYPPVCRECGMANHWDKKIGIYDRGMDRTVKWLCPCCEGQWER